MHNPADIENALSRLMPVALSNGAQTDIETMIDRLAGDSETKFSKKRPRLIWIASLGMAAAIVVGVFLSIPDQDSEAGIVKAPEVEMEDTPALVYLAESDRVENVSDEGLYVDAVGSAVRKLRVRMIEESQIRDEETGIVLTLSEPREEMYMVPVSTF